MPKKTKRKKGIWGPLIGAKGKKNKNKNFKKKHRIMSEKGGEKYGEKGRRRDPLWRRPRGTPGVGSFPRTRGAGSLNTRESPRLRAGQIKGIRISGDHAS